MSGDEKSNADLPLFDAKLDALQGSRGRPTGLFGHNLSIQ